MSKCSAKNRRCAGGDEWCIGGTLRIEDGATLDVAEGATVNGLAAGGGSSDLKVMAFLVTPSESFELKDPEGQTLTVENIVSELFKSFVVIYDTETGTLFYPVRIQYETDTILFGCYLDDGVYSFYIGKEPK